MSSAYEILGLGEGATLEEASRAYRRLALRYHPDRFVGRPASEVTAASCCSLSALAKSIADPSPAAGWS